jgi:hypothetical protein
MKHAALAALALLFWPIQGTTHGWAFSTVMLVAIYRDWKHAHAT